MLKAIRYFFKPRLNFLLPGGLGSFGLFDLCGELVILARFAPQFLIYMRQTFNLQPDARHLFVGFF